jgi:hypothetical protein
MVGQGELGIDTSLASLFMLPPFLCLALLSFLVPPTLLAYDSKIHNHRRSAHRQQAGLTAKRHTPFPDLTSYLGRISLCHGILS